jgi:AraC-like DNA-binding protein
MPMETLSFSAYQDLEGSPLNRCSQASCDRPLTVNCAGQFVTSNPFVTNNRTGRLDYYLLHVLSGELEIPMGGTRVIAKRGSAVVFPPNEPYRYTYTGGETLCYQWVHFTGSEAAQLLSLCGFSELPCIRQTEVAEKVSHGFAALYGAFGAQDAFRDRELAAILECLLISLGRAVGEGSVARGELSASLHYVMTAYAGEIRIPELAAMEHLSTPRYNAKFKALMGVSPSRYILQLRMGEACDLLRNTDFSIKEIAAMCGYRDPYFFSRAFKEYTGKSPRAYRNTSL